MAVKHLEIEWLPHTQNAIPIAIRHTSISKRTKAILNSLATVASAEGVVATTETCETQRPYNALAE